MDECKLLAAGRAALRLRLRACPLTAAQEKREAVLLGRAVQVDTIRPTVKAPGTKRLNKITCFRVLLFI